LNIEKTNFIQFRTKNKCITNLIINYQNQEIKEINHTKFLGLQIDQSLNWKKHIETIIPKLTSACFSLRVLKDFLQRDALRMVYFAYFHSIMKYGIIFLG